MRRSKRIHENTEEAGGSTLPYYLSSVSKCNWHLSLGHFYNLFLVSQTAQMSGHFGPQGLYLINHICFNGSSSCKGFPFTPFLFLTNQIIKINGFLLQSFVKKIFFLTFHLWIISCRLHPLRSHSYLSFNLTLWSMNPPSYALSHLMIQWPHFIVIIYL